MTATAFRLAFPYGFDRNARTAAASEEAHVRQLIEQLLFTTHGERVMRPDLGSGVAQLVFAPNALELAGATQMLIQGALQRFLGEIITVLRVAVEAIDSTLLITVQYALRLDGRVVTETFERPA